MHKKIIESGVSARYWGIFLVDRGDANRVSQIELLVVDNGYDVETCDPASIIKDIRSQGSTSTNNFTDGMLSRKETFREGDFIYWDIGAGNEAAPAFVRYAMDLGSSNSAIIQVRWSDDGSIWTSTDNVDMSGGDNNEEFTRYNYVEIPFP